MTIGQHELVGRSAVGDNSEGEMSEAEKKAELLTIPKKYDHIDFTPPKGAQDAGRRALEVRARGLSPMKSGLI